MSSSRMSAEDSAPSTSTVSAAMPSVSRASLALKPDCGSNRVPSTVSGRSWSVKPLATPSGRVSRQQWQTVVTSRAK